MRWRTVENQPHSGHAVLIGCTRSRLWHCRGTLSTSQSSSATEQDCKPLEACCRLLQTSRSQSSCTTVQDCKPSRLGITCSSDCSLKRPTSRIKRPTRVTSGKADAGSAIAQTARTLTQGEGGETLLTTSGLATEVERDSGSVGGSSLSLAV